MVHSNITIYLCVICLCATSVVCQNNNATENQIAQSTNRTNDQVEESTIKELYHPNKKEASEETTHIPYIDVTLPSTVEDDTTKSDSVTTKLIPSTTPQVFKEGILNSVSEVLEGGATVKVMPTPATPSAPLPLLKNATLTSLPQRLPTEPPQLGLANVEDAPITEHHQSSKGRKGAPTTQEASAIDNNCVCCTANNTSKPCILCCKDNDTKVDINNSSTLNNIVSLSPNVTSNSSDKGNIYRSSPPLTRKSKPKVTLDESPTNLPEQQQNPSSLSPESNYVIPIVATILAAPLLIVLLMFMYKRGTEFWERRHYRRMDFLIDGMYND